MTLEKIWGIDLLKYEESDVVELSKIFFEYYNVEFCLESLKQYNGRDVTLDIIDGTMEIHNDDGDIEKTIHLLDIPEFGEAILNRKGN